VTDRRWAVVGTIQLFPITSREKLTFETKLRRSSHESSDDMERATPAVDVLSPAGAKAIVAEADKSRRAADLNTIIVLIFQLSKCKRVDCVGYVVIKSGGWSGRCVGAS